MKIYIRLQRLFAWLLLSSICGLFFILSTRENPLFKPHYVLLFQLSKLLSTFDKGFIANCNSTSSIAYFKPNNTIEDVAEDVEPAQDWDSLLQHCGCVAGRTAMFFLALAAFAFIAAIRYGELVVTSLELLIKLMKACDWNSIMAALREAYQLSCHALGYLVYIYLQLNTMQRMTLWSLTVLIVSVRGIKSKSATGLLQASPIALVLILYAAAFHFCSATVIAWTTWVFANFTITIWGLSVLWRYYNMASDVLVVAGDESEVANVVTTLSLETSLLLELCFATLVLRFATALPLVSNVYNNLASFLALATVISYALFMSYGVDVEVSKNTLCNFPLARLNKWTLRTMDRFTFKRLKGTRLYSKDANKGAKPKWWLRVPSGIFDRLYSALCLVLGPRMGISENNYKLLTQAMNWIRVLPQLCLFLLPNFVSRLYYDYCTRIAPAIEIATLPIDASIAAKIKTLMLVLASDVFVRIINPLLLRAIPLYTFSRLIQLAALQVVTEAFKVKQKVE